MADLATLGLRVETQGVDRATNSLDQLDMSAKKVGGSAGQVKRATDALAQTWEKASSQARQMAEAIAQQEMLLKAQAMQAQAAGHAVLGLSGAYATGTAQAKANATAMMGLGRETAAAAAQARASAQAQANANAILEAGNRTIGGTVGLSRQARFGLIDLGRQFSDVGVSAAMGMNPLMILIQQGPQIADAFAIIRAGGLSVGAAFKAMAADVAAAVAPFVPFLAGAAAVAAMLGGGLLLGARAITKQNYQLVESLGLTEDQLESLTEKGTKLGVTFGDTLKATFQVIGRDLAKALHFDDAAKAFGDFLDNLTRWAADSVANIVGAFTGAVDAILAAWKQLPGAMGDLIISGANATLRAIADMLNAAQKLLTGKEGGFSAPQLFNPLQGQAASAGLAAGQAFASGFQKGAGATHQFFSDIGSQAVQNATDRILKDAGKAPRATHTPSDQTDQLRASVDQAEAQAQAAQLQAILSLTTDIRARADIQAQILQAEKAEKDAAIDKQIASIKAAEVAKHILPADAKDLIARLEGVKLVEDNVADLKQQAQAQKTAVDLIHQQAGLAQDALANQMDVLSSQEPLARLASERVAIERQLLDLQQQLARSKAQEAVQAAIASGDGAKIAQAMADQQALLKVQNNQIAAFDLETVQRAWGGLADDIDGMASAVGQHDWVSLVNKLASAFDNAATALSNLKLDADSAKGIGGAFGAVGNVVGGQAGSALSGIGAGFSTFGALKGATGLLAGLAPLAGPIGIAVGLGGLIGSLFGGNNHARDDAARAAAQKAYQAQAEATTAALQKLQQAQGDYASALEAFYTASGQSEKALQVQRDRELKGLDDASAAIQKQVYAWTDFNAAVAKANDAISQAQGDLKAAYDAEAKILQDQIDAVSAAQDQLRQAYQGQASDLHNTISQFQSFSDSLADFRHQLATGGSGGLSRQQSFRAASGDLSALNARIASGDTSALGNVQSTVNAFLSAAQAVAPDRITYLRNLALAQRSVDQAKALSDTQVSVAQQQLDTLNSQVGALIDIKSGVMSVADAIAALDQAQATAAQAQAQLSALQVQVGALIQINSSVMSVADAINALNVALAAKAGIPAPPSITPAANDPGGSYRSTHGDYAAYVEGNADLLASYNSVKSNPVWQQTITAAGLQPTEAGFGQFHWEHWGATEGRAVRPFALGGAFTNGIVNSPTLFDMGLMGEAGSEAIMPLHRGPDGSLGVRASNDNGGWTYVVDELQALRAEVAGFRAETRQGRVMVKSILDLFRRVTVGGNSVITSAAA